MKIFIFVLIFEEINCNKLCRKYVWPQNDHNRCSDNPMSSLLTINLAPGLSSIQAEHMTTSFILGMSPDPKWSQQMFQWSKVVVEKTL